MQHSKILIAIKTVSSPLSLSTLLFLIFSLPVKAMQADELVRHIDSLWRGTTSHAFMTMSIKTQRYQRNMTMEAWSLGNDYSLVVIQKPIKDRGISTLKVEQNIWKYLPKINRGTTVPSSMMSGSWSGSHFTNDDLVKESTFEQDYDSTITFEGLRNNQNIYELTSIPKPNAAVVWGKVVMQITQSTLAPIKGLYYDEDGHLIRTLTFDQIQKIGERIIPMRMTLQPIDKPSESTVILYNDIQFDIPLTKNFFSLRNLKQRH